MVSPTFDTFLWKNNNKTMNAILTIVHFFKLKKKIYLFLEREKGRKKEREKH